LTTSNAGSRGKERRACQLKILRRKKRDAVSRDCRLMCAARFSFRMMRKLRIVGSFMPSPLHAPRAVSSY
jgi:hypothetical protein